jgi:copper ion binding protein
MAETVLKVADMSCGHCVKAITDALSPLEGVASVAADLAAKTVTVKYEPAKTALEKIISAIEELGYEVAE